MQTLFGKCWVGPLWTIELTFGLFEQEARAAAGGGGREEGSGEGKESESADNTVTSSVTG